MAEESSDSSAIVGSSLAAAVRHVTRQSTAAPSDFIRLNRFDRAASFPLTEAGCGLQGELAGRAGDGASAREALDELLAVAVRTGPCYVLFSGGRDSSTLLAAATSLARRIGADDPIPVTVLHPDAPASDEREWQQAVLSHLRLDNQIVLEARGDQTLLSPTAIEGLRRHGPIWPEALQLHGFIYSQLAPGYVISGEGGDDTLGGRRISPIAEVVRRRRIGRKDLRPIVGALRPTALSRRSAARQFAAAQLFGWLRPGPRQKAQRLLAASVGEPLRCDRALLAGMGEPVVFFLKQNYEAVVRGYGHLPLNPYLEPSFRLAWAAQCGRLGPGGRTSIMRALFGDLLPDAVLARPTKASFNETRWHDRERDYAASWSGQGVAADLVDPTALRAAWMSADPPPGTDYLLHEAWYASEVAGVG